MLDHANASYSAASYPSSEEQITARATVHLSGDSRLISILFTERSKIAHCDTFSIAVIKITNGKIADSACISDITTVREKAEKIFSILTAGKVTPSQLSVIVEELIL